jgi:hypothetical protein
MVTKQSRRIVAGQTDTNVWCRPCNAHTAVRVALHLGGIGPHPAAYLTVCASCGTRFIPQAPQVTVTRPPRRRPRPLLALSWWRYRRECARRRLAVTGCALDGCPKPGWHDCCWYEPDEYGRIRWVFCGRKHRRRWLDINGQD